MNGNMKKSILNIYHSQEEGNYGLHILFEMSDTYLLFNSSVFLFQERNQTSSLGKWTRIDYKELIHNEVSIIEIKEDESAAYFIKFSNYDILYIYQRIDGLENRSQDFQIVSRDKDADKYKEINEHMNEPWIETIDPVL